METPPTKMLKGFNLKLCLALKTDACGLFTNFATIAPEDAPIVEPGAKSSREEDVMRQEIIAGAELLTGAKLQILNAVLKTLFAAER